jgi:uncharacterized membrane protein
VQPSARANDLIPAATLGAGASLLIAALAFSHLLLPILMAVAGIALLDLAMFPLVGLGRFVRARRG